MYKFNYNLLTINFLKLGKINNSELTTVKKKIIFSGNAISTE